MSLNLVNYSDSSSDEEIQQPIVKSNVKSKLPNPFGRSNEINTKVDHDDDEGEHDGRTRTFPHERGNWATYIYIQCPKFELISALQNELIDVLRNINSLNTVQFHAIDDLHLSLTRTVVLRHHWIDEFVRSIEISIKNTQRFWINFNSIRIYCNDNQTRTFISLSFTEIYSNTQPNLQNIVKKLNKCLAEFKLASFYEEASFHVSILWCLGDKQNELTELLPQFCNILERLSSVNELNLAIHVEQLFCKIGNKLYRFPL